MSKQSASMLDEYKELWLQILAILGILLVAGMIFVLPYKDVNPLFELFFFISMALLFLILLVKQHKRYMHMQKDREELIEKLRRMADDRYRKAV